MSTAKDIEPLTLTNTPLDNPDKMAEAAELWRAIGLATSSWARLETHIDMVLIHLNQPKHSVTLYAKEHPIGFKSKVKLLKRWFNGHPLLRIKARELREIAPQFLALGKQRNLFLHSIVSDYNPTTREVIWRGIRAAGEETYQAGRHVGSVDQLLNFATEAHSAHVRLAKLCRDLYDAGTIERLRGSSSAFRV
jgi:hypothetical protein